MANWESDLVAEKEFLETLPSAHWSSGWSQSQQERIPHSSFGRTKRHLFASLEQVSQELVQRRKLVERGILVAFRWRLEAPLDFEFPWFLDQIHCEVPMILATDWRLFQLRVDGL